MERHLRYLSSHSPSVLRGRIHPAVPLVALAEPDLMLHRPLQRGFGGLCDGGPLVCTRIDRIAFHAGADAIILTSTSPRATGFVTSYGVSVGLAEHVEGGIFSNTAIWGRPSGNQTDTFWQQGPVRTVPSKASYGLAKGAAPAFFGPAGFRVRGACPTSTARTSSAS